MSKIRIHLPESARVILRLLVDSFAALEARIAVLDAEIDRRAKADPVARRLMTIPGVGPITATAVTALAPAPGSFRTGRDFAAWLGLTPLQKSTGGKQKLGAVSKRGERTMRRLLIIGASAVVKQAFRRGHRPGRGWRRCWPASQDAGHRGPGQQDGPYRLGAVGQRRRLQSSGRGRVS